MNSKRRTIAEIMDGAPVNPGCKPKKIANNTVRYIDNEGGTRIRLHRTDIITITSDDVLILNSGGWKTSTTKDRINRFTSIRLWQRAGDWFFTVYGKTYVFADGVSICGGIVKGAADHERRKNPLLKQIKAYADAFAKALPVDWPGGGDCWGCAMREAGTGSEVMGYQHLLDHIKEKYYVPSLLYHAMKEAGAGPAWYWSAFKDEKGQPGRIMLPNGNRSYYAKWIRKYMEKRLVDGRRG